MKRTALLINTAREPIVEDAALDQALREGWIAGAALDDIEEDLLPRSPVNSPRRFEEEAAHR